MKLKRGRATVRMIAKRQAEARHFWCGSRSSVIANRHYSRHGARERRSVMKRTIYTLVRLQRDPWTPACLHIQELAAVIPVRRARVCNFRPPLTASLNPTGGPAALSVLRRQICGTGMAALVDDGDDKDVVLTQVVDDAPGVGGDL